MTAPRERIRPSATVILWRRAPDLEVYLVERGRRTRFFPGYHVFPGGVLDEADGSGAEARGRAALRELFEETGVLVTTPHPPASFPRVGARRSGLADEMARHGLSWDTSRLEEAGRLVTPPFGPLRYDTTFHVCQLPEGEEPAVDGEELVSGGWWRPAEALRRWNEEAFPIPPPTLAYLRLLARHDDARKVAQLARATDGRPHHERFRIEMHPGAYVLPLRTPTLPPATTTNCHLLDGDTLVVIDPGTPYGEEQEALFQTLDGMRREGQPGVVLLTHHHGDHVAAAEALKLRYGFPVLAHPATRDALPEGLVDGTLGEGDVVEVGRWHGRPWRLRVLHTPGHTPGHLAFLDERWGFAFVGDLVSGASTILVDPLEGDMAAYMDSLARLASMPLHGVLAGHGPLMPAAVLAETLEHRRVRERKVLAALRGEPRSPVDLLPEAYDDTPREAWGLAQRSLLSHLLKLEKEGKVARKGGDWVRA